MTTQTEYTARLERAYRRLGTRTPACVTCGESNAFCLELHHIGERAHHDDLAIVCRNCHRKLTDPQKDRIEVHASDPSSEMIGRYLCGLADLLLLIAHTVREFGERLLGLGEYASGGSHDPA
ncbi:hypothetical protein [Oceanicaulis sp. UBA2681]|uniref:hypothetical protein n=1 Tax=Oceanicaulis sp. UBA2681 TaxID=1947007 RepID=UPI00257D7090|nr:hypothetical protein [Oceanicaulis sp. UBA2681]|tara:strand:+ start:8609 stop:8974 length:366 start_codon:yes stop_codon:yes gene_type:complete